MQLDALTLIALAFGDKQVLPKDVPQVPQLARLISQVTAANFVLRAVEGAPTLGEELNHLLRTLEGYLEMAMPGEITKREWAKAISEGRAYEEFEALRHEADRGARSIQLERQLHLKWAPRPLRVADLLWHVADHTIHHRGRLALLLRLCGNEPAAS